MPEEIQERFAKWLYENFEMAFSRSWKEIIDDKRTQYVTENWRDNSREILKDEEFLSLVRDINKEINQ